MYCSRTIFEDATPELVRDFFWDGDFRLKWDPMLGYSKTLDEFPQSGATIVHWIKKVSSFCCSLCTFMLKSQFQHAVCFPVPILLQWPWIHLWRTHMGIGEDLLLCYKGVYTQYLLTDTFTHVMLCSLHYLKKIHIIL